MSGKDITKFNPHSPPLLSTYTTLIMAHFSNVACPPFDAARGQVFSGDKDQHGVVIGASDRRSINYNKVPRAPSDNENGTEHYARIWAREFYLSNKTFLRASITTRRGLAFFFMTWFSSVRADDTRLNTPLRPFSQILFALCNDGNVLHLRNHDHQRGRLRDPVIVWHQEASAPRKTVTDAVTSALKHAVNQNDITSVHISHAEGHGPHAAVYYATPEDDGGDR